MKIIYKQPQSKTVFENFGIKNCYFKQLFCEDRTENVTKKEHHHTGFEIHIMEKGHQTYKICDKKCKIKEGYLFLIPPKSKHCSTDYAPHTSKVSITFNVNASNPYALLFDEIKEPIICKTNQRINNSIKYLLEENKEHRFFSPIITENLVFEILVLILRLCGFNESSEAEKDTSEDARLSMAKNYIKDNIELNLLVCDIASYCYLGTKQLTRLFKSSENITPALYIRNQKIEYIEKLLSETNLSFRTISEKMNFSSEYHFHSFFKKYAGVTPGEYRKMQNKYLK